MVRSHHQGSVVRQLADRTSADGWDPQHLDPAMCRRAGTAASRRTARLWWPPRSSLIS